MPIQTARLTLRCFVAEDFEALRELESDPAVLRYRSRKQIDPEMTREFLDRARQSIHQQPRTLYAYAILRRADTGWLGQCGLTLPSAAMPEAYLWYALLPRYWGQGYMTEAVQALAQVGVTEFNLKRILAECHPHNLASIRVMEKAGLQFEGLNQLSGAHGERVRYSSIGVAGTTHWVAEPPL